METDGGNKGREQFRTTISLLQKCTMSVRPALTPFMIFAGKTVQDVDDGERTDT